MCIIYHSRRLRGQVLNPQDRRNLAVEVAKDGEDTEDTNRLRNSACSSRNSEDVDSAESADSRTQVCCLISDYMAMEPNMISL